MFACPRLDYQVNILLSEVVLDVEVLGELASFPDELMIVTINEQDLVEIVTLTPRLEKAVLEDKIVFFKHFYHVGDAF